MLKKKVLKSTVRTVSYISELAEKVLHDVLVGKSYLHKAVVKIKQSKNVMPQVPQAQAVCSLSLPRKESPECKDCKWAEGYFPGKR